MMKEFNIVIAGVGGQGVITLMQIIAEAALEEGYDVKTSELHGLAQRGGSVPCHIRFGKKIYSPLVMQGEAHLIIGLEPLESLRACYFGSRENKTTFLINSYRIIPLSVPVLKLKYPSMREIVESLKKFSSRVIVLNASQEVKKLTNNITMTNIYMLGYASGHDLIPLSKESFTSGIEKIIPKRFLEINKSVFEMGLRA